MGRINGKTDNTRSEEERLYSDSHSRGCRDAGLQGADSRDKPERINRTYGAESNFFRSGGTAAGGILSQLIDEYRDQVAAKKLELDRLEARINQFEALLEELQQRSKDE